MTIEAIGQTGNYADLAAIARRIYTLFHAEQVEITGGRVLASVRERQVRRAELPDGVPYRRLGHVFRVDYAPISED